MPKKPLIVLLFLTTFLCFSCSSETESTKAMFTETIDNILVEKTKRQMHLRQGDEIIKTYKILAQSQKQVSFIAEDFVPECGANQGRERRQLRARRRHHDSRLPEQGSRIPL